MCISVRKQDQGGFLYARKFMCTCGDDGQRTVDMSTSLGESRLRNVLLRLLSLYLDFL